MMPGFSICGSSQAECSQREGKGAYVHVAAWAESRSHFEARVKVSAEQLDCILREIEEVGLLETKMQAETYPEEFLDMRQHSQSSAR
jgi:hypothetical protein